MPSRMAVNSHWDFMHDEINSHWDFMQGEILRLFLKYAGASQPMLGLQILIWPRLNCFHSQSCVQSEQSVSL